jgi:undecaprenyl-diphosphatase
MMRHDPFLRFCVVTGLICLLVSLALAAAISGDNALVRFDHDFASSLHDHTGSPLIEFFKVIAWIGPKGVYLGGLLGAAWLIVRGEWGPLGIGVITIIGGRLINMQLKQLFDRQRPHFPDPLATEPGAGFPSGHAMMATLGYGFLVMLVWSRLPTRRMRIALAASTVVYVLLIGFSRLYLGVHYPSDVIAGYAMGGAWLLLWAGLGRIAERRVQLENSN